MDILESRYYRINKFLLTCLGQWPFQRTGYKRLFRIGYACVVMSITVPVILRLMETWDDFDHAMECISILTVQTATSVKYCNYIFNGDKIKKLMLHIQRDWKSDIYQPHFETLRRYATEGEKLTLFYTVYMYSTLGTFVLMPIMPKIMDTVMPLNRSRPLVYPLPVTYGNIDMDKYYIPMMLHADCAAFIAITTIVTIDTTHALYVEHACGSFAALGDRLQYLLDTNEHAFIDKVKTTRKRDTPYQAVVECVKMHKGAIEFAKAIESSHTIVWFFVIGLSVLCMSLAGFQVVMNLDKPNEAFRFAVFTLAQFFHMFFNHWPGQKLIDHSERIHDLVYESQWYEASSRSKKLLILMMMRSIKPCRLTAGKLYDISFTNFSTVIKTSMSYFTVFTSFR